MDKQVDLAQSKAVNQKPQNGDLRQTDSHNISLGKHVTLESSILEEGYAHAVHCMIWSKWDEHFVLEEFNPYAAVLMQMRFDGTIGFSGGMIDENMTGISLEQAEEKCISALTRELAEEMNVDFTHHTITKDDYLFTYRHPCPSKKLFLHFYTFEVSIDSLREIETMALKSMDYGNELFGVLRVPLYTMKDGYKGFPAFLNNNFVQCSRQQLLEALEKKSIMPKTIINEAIAASIENRATLI